MNELLKIKDKQDKKRKLYDGLLDDVVCYTTCDDIIKELKSKFGLDMYFKIVIIDNKRYVEWSAHEAKFDNVASWIKDDKFELTLDDCDNDIICKKIYNIIKQNLLNS
jgi:hypothetical protein